MKHFAEQLSLECVSYEVSVTDVRLMLSHCKEIRKAFFSSFFFSDLKTLRSPGSSLVGQPDETEGSI